MQLWELNTDLAGCSVGEQFITDHLGREVWVIAMKQGWEYDGEFWQPLVTPKPIYREPQYRGEAGFSAIEYDLDLVPTKANTDVIVNGVARSLMKRPVDRMTCRLLVEEHIDKRIDVIGERAWYRHGGGIAVTKAAEFIEASMNYQRAMGGEHPANRIGCGVAESLIELEKQPVPSQFYSGQDWALGIKAYRPAGFDVVPPFFAERSKFAGTFDAKWEEERSPLLPEDFNPAFYQCAPADQQCEGKLTGGERIALSGFCHEGALTFFVPAQGYEVVLTTQQGPMRAKLSLNTLYIDTEQRQIHAVWGAGIDCEEQAHLIESATVIASATEEANP